MRLLLPVAALLFLTACGFNPTSNNPADNTPTNTDQTENQEESGPVTLTEVASAWEGVDRYRFEGTARFGEFINEFEGQVGEANTLYLETTSDARGSTFRYIRAGGNIYKKEPGSPWQRVEGVQEIGFDHQEFINEFIDQELEGTLTERNDEQVTEFTYDSELKEGSATFWVDQESQLPVAAEVNQDESGILNYRWYDYGAEDFTITEPL